MPNKYKVIVADDHSFFRKGVMFAVNRMPNFEVVAEATSGLDVIEKLKNNKAQVVLMDIKMPVMDGIDATKEIKRKYPDIDIIALTMHGDEAYIESMLSAGAKGYMLKDAESEDLEFALKSIVEGKQYFSQSIIPQLTSSFLNRNKEKTTTELTNRELEILSLICKGFSNSEIADQLNLSHRTITTHRTNIYAKLNVKNTASLISYAIKSNLVDLA